MVTARALEARTLIYFTNSIPKDRKGGRGIKRVFIVRFVLVFAVGPVVKRVYVMLS